MYNESNLVGIPETSENTFSRASNLVPRASHLALIERAALKNRLAHLLIFHGGSALGRKNAGLRLAQVLNCLSAEETRPCLKCPACRKIISGNHPDVAILEPLKTSIGIEQVLVWQEKVYRKHYEGHYKIFLIDQADRLTVPAANALLKVIEEPPERTVIILSAQNIESVLPTIRSRAQMVYFPPPDYSGWVKMLEEVEPEEARAAFAMSGGSADMAGGILQQGVSSVNAWIERYRTAVRNKDFLQLFPLFPVEKDQALLYLQALAVRTESELSGPVQASALLEIGKAVENIERQANPRLALEILALQLIKSGDTPESRY